MPRYKRDGRTLRDTVFFLLYHNNMEVVNLLVRMPNVTPLGHINYRMRHKKYFQNGVVFISKFSYSNS